MQKTERERQTDRVNDRDREGKGERDEMEQLKNR